ncbi:MAG: OsmC family protein [Sphingomonadales bacterium]
MLDTPNKILNGVDVTALNETIDAVNEDASLAIFKFRADNKWLGGGWNRTAINAFYGAGEDQQREQPFFYDNDEPAVLLGADRSANPVEFLLHALVGCLTSTIAYLGAIRGIEIEKIDSEIQGEMDARGFLDLADNVTIGYKSIEVKFRVKTSAEAKIIRELALFSPVYHTINGKTPVEVSVETY